MALSAIGNTSDYSTNYSYNSSSQSDKSKNELTPSQMQETGESQKQNSDNSVAEELSHEEKNEVKKLKKIDQEVRAHEMAHIAAGGQYVRGGASFEYQTGPDGHKYAVGGEVSIDTSKISGDADATIRKMQTVRKAALAPANPSAQDRSVAAQASQVETQARQEKVREKEEGAEESNKDSSSIENENNNTYTKQGTVENHSSKTPEFEAFA